MRIRLNFFLDFVFIWALASIASHNLLIILFWNLIMVSSVLPSCLISLLTALCCAFHFWKASFHNRFYHLRSTPLLNFVAVFSSWVILPFHLSRASLSSAKYAFIIIFLTLECPVFTLLTSYSYTAALVF